MSQGKWIIVIGTYLLIGLGSFLGSQLKIDLSLSTLSSQESVEFKNYQEYAQQFPVHDSVLIISVISIEKFTSLAKFEQIDRLSKDLIALKGISNLSSITQLSLPRKNAFGTHERTFLPLTSAEKFQKSYSKLDSYPDITPKFLSKNREAARMYMDVDWNQLSVEKIKAVIRSDDFDEVYLSGSEIFKSDVSENLARELFVLPSLAAAFLLLLFFVWFQELRSLIVIISILGLNLALVLSVFWMSGIDIGTLTATVPLLIVVLSFCDIVHVIHRFKQQDGSVPIEERIRMTTKPLRISLWLTSLTTFSAFAMFFVSGVDEIIEFALTTCAGIAFAYLTARFILPVFIVMFRVKPFRRKEAFSRIQAQLIQAQKYYKWIAGIAVLICIVCGIGAMRYSTVNSSYHQHFGEETAMGSSMRFTDQYFDGVRTIEVIVKAENVLTPATIRAVDSIENYLLNHYQCRSVFSVNNAIKRLNRFNRFGHTSFYRLPDSLGVADFQRLEEFGEKLGLSNAMTKDKRVLRIVGRLPDIGSAEATKRNHGLEEFIQGMKTSDREVFMSGFSYVKDQSTTRITHLILLGIALSLLIAGVIIGMIFKSWKVAAISILPNLLPLLAALLFIEITGMGLNAASVMALSILLGLSLDDTIYFLGSNYKKGTRGVSVQGIEKGLRENTFPAMVTSLILSVGFGVLAFSDIQSNRNIGILVGSMLLFALISDLLIFPALLRVIATIKRV